MDEPPSSALVLAILFGDGLFIALCLGAITLLLALSAFISASEVAFFSLKRTVLQHFEISANAQEKVIADLLKTPQPLLATMLVMSNLINVGIIIISFYLMWAITGTKNPSEFIIGLVTLLVTFCLGLISGIAPKVYASRNNLKFVMYAGNTWRKLLFICRPLTSLVVYSWKRIEDRYQAKGQQISADELNQAFERAAESEKATEEERDMLKGIVNFGTLTVRQIMRSRVDISALDEAMNFHELMDYINKSGFSRMPVFRDTIDKIEGVLYIKDILPFIDQDENFRWQKLIRPGFFVPENKKIDSLLKDFQKKHVHIAMVVDEYGGTLGLITLEDIIEEIIGEINDEFDEEARYYKTIDENTFVFEGKTSLHDFCKALDVDGEIFDAIKGDSESLGGLILELTNELPNVGKKISFEQFTFVIEAVDKKRIKRVRVHIHEQKES